MTILDRRERRQNILQCPQYLNWGRVQRGREHGMSILYFSFWPEKRSRETFLVACWLWVEKNVPDAHTVFWKSRSPTEEKREQHGSMRSQFWTTKEGREHGLSSVCFRYFIGPNFDGERRRPCDNETVVCLQSQRGEVETALPSGIICQFWTEERPEKTSWGQYVFW